MPRSRITGFWTFNCNPKYWAIDDYLFNIDIGRSSIYRITTWQKFHFKIGQLGVIRVGFDTRNKEQLNGRKRLERGIYAIVEIIGLPYPQNESNSSFSIIHQKCEPKRFVIPIKYIRNYICSPVLLSKIENDYIVQRDPYLLNGLQAATMPLLEDTFNRILLYGEEGEI